MTQTDQAPDLKAKSQKLHRISLIILGIVVVLFLLLTTFVDLPSFALMALYAVLVASAIFFMSSTMLVMINRNGGQKSGK